MWKIQPSSNVKFGPKRTRQEIDDELLRINGIVAMSRGICYGEHEWINTGFPFTYCKRCGIKGWHQNGEIIPDPSEP